MKKVLSILALVAAVAVVSTSCGKKCVCTRYEDGKKVYSFTDSDIKYFESSACEFNSVPAYQGESEVIFGKSVTVEIKCK